MLAGWDSILKTSLAGQGTGQSSHKDTQRISVSLVKGIGPCLDQPGCPSESCEIIHLSMMVQKPARCSSGQLWEVKLLKRRSGMPCCSSCCRPKARHAPTSGRRNRAAGRHSFYEFLTSDLQTSTMSFLVRLCVARAKAPCTSPTDVCRQLSIAQACTRSDSIIAGQEAAPVHDLADLVEVLLGETAGGQSRGPVAQDL